jgi:hypothetical protein
VSIVGAILGLRIYTRVHIVNRFQLEDWLICFGFVSVSFHITSLSMILTSTTVLRSGLLSNRTSNEPFRRWNQSVGSPLGKDKALRNRKSISCCPAANRMRTDSLRRYTVPWFYTDPAPSPSKPPSSSSSPAYSPPSNAPFSSSTSSS